MEVVEKSSTNLENGRVTLPEVVAARKEIIAEVERLLSSKGAPIVVALDGGSGAGKSTLASLIETEFDAAVIPLDDFFAGDIKAHEWDTFTVEEKLRHVFHWGRLRELVIKPLLERRRATWHAFDFASGFRPDGTYGMEDDPREREPADVILVEGAYSAGPQLADLVDLSILVAVPVQKRHARLRAREAKDFLAKWHERWDDVEECYFTQLRPKGSFDLIVSGD